MSKELAIHDLGLCDYQEVWTLQQELQRRRIQREVPDTLLICEHPTVITCGRSAKAENILLDAPSLAERGVAVFKIERGGDVTLHNPGQLVLYPILYLGDHRKDVGWYMRTLEELIIKVLARYKLTGERISGKTGVWLSDRSSGPTVSTRKIASIGVRISRWVTMHGLSLNVSNNLQEFQMITPCGLPDAQVTSVDEELKLCSTSPAIPSIMQVKDDLLSEFSHAFAFGESKACRIKQQPLVEPDALGYYRKAEARTPLQKL